MDLVERTKMIGPRNCPITLSHYNFLEQNTAAYAPITFEEIVIVMPRLTILLFLAPSEILII